MNQQAYDVFFEKTAAMPLALSLIGKVTSPVIKLFEKKPKLITVPKPKKRSGIISVALPSAFMMSEGSSAVKNISGSTGGLGAAKNMPQTSNPWQTF